MAAKPSQIKGRRDLGSRLDMVGVDGSSPFAPTKILVGKTRAYSDVSPFNLSLLA